MFSFFCFTLLVLFTMEVSIIMGSNTEKINGLYRGQEPVRFLNYFLRVIFHHSLTSAVWRWPWRCRGYFIFILWSKSWVIIAFKHDSWFNTMKSTLPCLWAAFWGHSPVVNSLLFFLKTNLIPQVINLCSDDWAWVTYNIVPVSLGHSSILGALYFLSWSCLSNLPPKSCVK